MNESTVSVVVVSYNTGPILFRMLDSVLSQEGLKELILVDNGNTEATRIKLQDFAGQEPRMKILSGHGNIGFSAGCNLGAKETSGEYILLLNPDSILPNHALLDMTAAMQQHPDAWLAGCQMINPDGSEQGGSKRNLLTPRIAFTQALRLHRINPISFPSLNMATAKEETEPSFVPAISGAFMMMKRDKYEEIGGMDEGYFFHVEDLDLCYYINSLGGKILYVPGVRVIHYRSTSEVSYPFIEWHKTGGFVRYFKNHFRTHKIPGFFYLIVAGIYVRLLLRLVPLSLADHKRRKKLSLSKTLQQRQLSFLEEPVPASVNGVNESELEALQPVLLIGTSGQVGLSILRRMLALEPFHVYAMFHNDIINYDHTRLHWIHGDIAGNTFDLNGIQPKTVICTAPLWFLPDHIPALAHSGVKRIVAFSSTSIMGKSASRNMYEKKLVQRLEKAEERLAKLCRLHNIHWTVFRPTMIYGIGLDKNVSSIVRFIERTGFFPVTRPGKGLRQPVHADDLAGAVIKSLTTPACYDKCYNLVGGSTLNYTDMVGRIFSALKKRPRIFHVRRLPVFLDIYSFLTGKKDINGEVAKRMERDLVFDATEATADFGYTPREFLQEGLSDLGMGERNRAA